MKRLNIGLNTLLFSLGLVLLGTALLLEFRMPHGREGVQVLFLGLDRHEWGAIHWWIGLMLAFGVTLHLGLHWRWIWRVAASQRRGLLLGVAIVSMAVLAFFAFVPTEPIEHQPGQGLRRGAQAAQQQEAASAVTSPEREPETRRGGNRQGLNRAGGEARGGRGPYRGE